jgi:hypothetical protein
MPWDPSKYDDEKVDGQGNDDEHEVATTKPTIDPGYDAYFSKLKLKHAYSFGVDCYDESSRTLLRKHLR